MNHAEYMVRLMRSFFDSHFLQFIKIKIEKNPKTLKSKHGKWLRSKQFTFKIFIFSKEVHEFNTNASILSNFSYN